MAAKDVDFASFVRQGPFDAAAAFVYGSDQDFVEAALAQLVTSIKAARADFPEIERAPADVISSDAPLVLDFFAEQGLFGDHRLLILNGVAERHSTVLLELFKSSPSKNGSMLLLCSHSLKTKSKLLAAARSSGFCVMIKAYEAPLTRQDVTERLNSLEVAHLEPAAVDLAHRRLRSLDPARRDQTLKLLALYANDGRLSEQDVLDCLPPSEDQEAGEVISSILRGDAPALLQWRRGGALEGVDPIQQLAVIARALSEARRARTGGGGPPVFWKTDKAIKDAARRFTDLDQRLEQAATAAHELERAARSSQALIPEKTERFLLRLGQQFS